MEKKPINDELTVELHELSLMDDPSDLPIVFKSWKPATPPKQRVHSKKFLAERLDYHVPDKIQAEPIFWDQRIERLEKYFAHINLPSGSFVLDQCTTIYDIPGFIESHMTSIQTENRSEVNLPNLERLEKLMEILEA